MATAEGPRALFKGAVPALGSASAENMVGFTVQVPAKTWPQSEAIRAIVLEDSRLHRPGAHGETFC